MSHRFSALTCKNPSLSRYRTALFVCIAGATLISCGSPATKPEASSTPSPPIGAISADYSPMWTIRTARHSTVYLPLHLLPPIQNLTIRVGVPDGPAAWIGQNSLQPMTLVSAKANNSGPGVAQLTGSPVMAVDEGSTLVAIDAQNNGEKPASTTWVERSFRTNASADYLQLEVSSLQQSGVYNFPVQLQFSDAVGGRTVRGELQVNVADVAFPSTERVLGVVTTTLEQLQSLLPQTFGNVRSTQLDRGNDAAPLPIAVLDSLQAVAHARGLTLFVEDLGPRIHIDDVGRVILDWDAYDRIVGPWMDGTAFEDRAPLGVWVAPVPPKRIAGAPTQLMQYLDACAKHFSDKGWSSAPAVLLAPFAEGSTVAPSVRSNAGEMLKLHVGREVLAISPAGGGDPVRIPQPRLWNVTDGDSNVPSAGLMATRSSVEAWPWMCAARGGGEAGNVRGFVWRNAIGALSTDPSAGGAGWATLFAVAEQMEKRKGQKSLQPVVVAAPTLRLTWLNAGMNGVRLLGLLEQRADERTVKEVLADIVARSGMSQEVGSSVMPTADAGNLHANWSSDDSMWDALPEKMQTLLASHVPGENAESTSPDALAVKLWLAQGRRPSARVAGYQFHVDEDEASRLLVSGAVDVLAENPIASRVGIDGSLMQLPGDWVQKGETQQQTDFAGLGVSRLVFPIEGHAGTIEGASRRAALLQLRERDGGATFQMPVQLPVIRIEPTENELTIDGDDGDWGVAGQAATMAIDHRYLNHPTYIKGETAATTQASSTATAKWLMDRDMLYVTIRCPQATIADDRTNDWPLREKNWWGTDGVQLQLGAVPTDTDKNFTRLIRLGFKPSGVLIAMTGEVKGSALTWAEGLPHLQTGGHGLKYGVKVERMEGKITGWVIEAAIPRAWFTTADADGAETPASAWRVNILRHTASDDSLRSESWSGPIVNDEDVSMMGLMVADHVAN